MVHVYLRITCIIAFVRPSTSTLFSVSVRYIAPNYLTAATITDRKQSGANRWHGSGSVNSGKAIHFLNFAFLLALISTVFNALHYPKQRCFLGGFRDKWSAGSLRDYKCLKQCLKRIVG